MSHPQTVMCYQVPEVKQTVKYQEADPDKH